MTKSITRHLFVCPANVSHLGLAVVRYFMTLGQQWVVGGGRPNMLGVRFREQRVDVP